MHPGEGVFRPGLRGRQSVGGDDESAYGLGESREEVVPPLAQTLGRMPKPRGRFVVAVAVEEERALAQDLGDPAGQLVGEGVSSGITARTSLHHRPTPVTVGSTGA
jgi:hypothetical protein